MRLPKRYTSIPTSSLCYAHPASLTQHFPNHNLHSSHFQNANGLHNYLIFPYFLTCSFLFLLSVLYKVSYPASLKLHVLQMFPTLHDGWGILFRGHVLRVDQAIKRYIMAHDVHTTQCFPEDLINSFHKPIVITTTHNFSDIPSLTMDDVRFLKLPCMHSDHPTVVPPLPLQQNPDGIKCCSALSAERANVFYYPKTLQLVPNIERVIVVMAIKQIVALQVRISNVQVLQFSTSSVVYSITPTVVLF